MGLFYGFGILRSWELRNYKKENLDLGSSREIVKTWSLWLSTHNEREWNVIVSGHMVTAKQTKWLRTAEEKAQIGFSWEDMGGQSWPNFLCHPHPHCLKTAKKSLSLQHGERSEQFKHLNVRTKNRHIVQFGAKIQIFKKRNDYLI